MNRQKASWILILVAIGVVFGLVFLAARRPVQGGFLFVPLGTTTNVDGSILQSFAISNTTSDMTEYVLGRYRRSTSPTGQTLSNLESHVYFRLPAHSGTQVALSLPSHGEPWQATLNYRRVVGRVELGAKAVGYQLNMLNTNQVFPVWQSTNSPRLP